MLIAALIFALNAPWKALGGDVVCDKVVTTSHGILKASRVTDKNDGISSKMCLGELRLLDIRNKETWCLASKPEGRVEDVLECAESGANVTTEIPPYCPTSAAMPEYIWISSSGEAAKWNSGVAGFLGQYRKGNSDRLYYIQSNSRYGSKVKPTAEPVYLLPDRNCRWYLSQRPFENGYDKYRDRNPSRGLPTASGGWKIYHERKKTWVNDPTFKVNPDPYPLQARYGFTVTLSGEADRLYSPASGWFRKTDLWWMGRPVFQNNKGRKLFHGNLGWVIGTQEGRWEIRGLGSHISPEQQTDWEYLTYTDGQKDDFTKTTGVKIIKGRPRII